MYIENQMSYYWTICGFWNKCDSIMNDSDEIYESKKYFLYKWFIFYSFKNMNIHYLKSYLTIFII